MSEETRNPRTRDITIESLDFKCVLRPLPIFLCREISKHLKPLIEQINKTGRMATVMMKQVEALQAKYGREEIDLPALMKETAELADKLQEATPKNMDDDTATAVVEVFEKIIKFYNKNGPSISKKDIEDKASMEEVIYTLDQQLELNSNNDFLLSSLQFVLKLVKESNKEVSKLTEALK